MVGSLHINSHISEDPSTLAPIRRVEKKATQHYVAPLIALSAVSMEPRHGLNSIEIVRRRMSLQFLAFNLPTLP